LLLAKTQKYKSKGGKMKLKIIHAACTSLLLAVSSANASLINITDWHETSDGYGGLKVSSFADDLFLAVSKSGTYNKGDTYEMLSGYHWATFEEMNMRLSAYRAENHYKTIEDRNYHNLGGWDKYTFNGIERRDFIYSNTDLNTRTIAVSLREYQNASSPLSYNANYSDISLSSVSKWAGFVLIKEVPEPSTFAVFALGMLGLVTRKLRK